MNFFEFIEYKTLVNSWIARQPKAGRGQFRRIALHLEVNPVLISQIFRGPKNLTIEQAFALAEYLNASDLERDYFLLLVQNVRAGTPKLRQHFAECLKELRERSRELKNRVIKKIELTEEDKAIFYSDWLFSAIRIASSIPEYQSVEAIAKRFDVPKTLVQNIADFLVSRGLCAAKEGRLEVGPSHTHLGSDSLLIKNRQCQWRMKGIQRMDQKSKEDLFYTGPMALSRSDVEKVRGLLSATIQQVVRAIETSPSEELACLNVDWFKI